MRPNWNRVFGAVSATTLAIALNVVCTPRAQSTPVYSTLHTFNVYDDGLYPAYGPLLAASDGNLYGITASGGTNNDGSVYQVSPTGGFKTIRSFTTNGQSPNGGLVEGSDGLLYGTTSGGGLNGYGEVFKVSKDGTTFTQMYSFTGGTADGGGPSNGLVIDSSGNLYGATGSGGASGSGTIYTIPINSASVRVLGSLSSSVGTGITSPLVVSGTKLYGAAMLGGANGAGALISVAASGVGGIIDAYSFTVGDAAGWEPHTIFKAANGNLYGMSTGGGVGDYIFAFNTSNSTVSALCNVTQVTGAYESQCILCQGPSGLLYYSDGEAAFSVSTTGGSIVVLHRFDGLGGADSGVIVGPDGALYGTWAGGDGTPSDGGIYRLTTTGSTFGVLFDFGNGIHDGLNPGYGKLLCGADGQLHGSTMGSELLGPNDGALFSVSPSGDYILDAYVTGSPYGGLVTGPNGNYYGTTWQGGYYGAGSAFELLPGDVFNTFFSFGEAAGANIPSGLIVASDGNFYGASYWGGQFSCGAIFRLSPIGQEQVLYSFTGGSDGLNPNGGLIQGTDGDFYGTTSMGGANSDGTVFRFSLTNGLSTLATFDGDVAGAHPFDGVIEAADGNLYGTAESGGGGSGLGDGTIFSLPRSGNGFSSIYDFTGANGGTPIGGLTQGSDGQLYGTTSGFGASNEGEVFSIPTTLSSLTVLHSFSDATTGGLTTDGYDPIAGVVEGPDGNLYGTCSEGGSQPYAGVNVQGTVYEIQTALPIINSFSPTSGLGGQQVTIDGANFGVGPLVAFNGSAAPVVSSTSSQIVSIVPAQATTGIIAVTSNGVATVSAGNFTIIPPTIGSLSRYQGLAGQTLTITGSNFVGVTGVAFAGPTAVTPSVVNPQTITVTVPANGMSGPVTVTTYGGEASSHKSFVYKKPAIVKFAPMSGSAGTHVTITGSGFAGVSSVTFDGTPSSYTVHSSTSITATVPTGATTGSIDVNTPGGIGIGQQPFTVK